LENCE